jgi:hypothetical protein
MQFPGFYKKDVVEAELEQGDLLVPTDELSALLTKYHPYYAQHPENRFYAILTQSCDLVRRGGSFGARYILIAPVRSLRTVIHYEYDSKLLKPNSGDPFGTETVKADVERFLERILNNNEPTYFHYFEENAVGLVEPMCAMLGLPISLKVEHYDIFLKSRKLSIEAVFQAKLGWLIGQTFSRVGTPEMRSDHLKNGIADITRKLAVWIPNDDFKHFRRILKEHTDANPGKPIDLAVRRELIKQIPKKKAMVVERILDLATEAKLLVQGRSPERRNFRNVLEQDAKFSTFFQKS